MTTNSFSNRLVGKTAIVTGGGSGIGQAITQAFVAEGAKVLIVGRRQKELEELANSQPGKIEYIQEDVTHPGSSRAIVEYALSVFGSIDILVNNAGTASLKPLAMQTDDEIDAMLSTNVRVTLSMSRDAIGALEESKGVVINISSVGAQAAVPGMCAYSATKSAVDRLTKILAVELGPMGIRVNAVAPGLTNTDMLTVMPDEHVEHLVQSATALRRVGQPEDIANSVVWLASDNAGWVTGQIVQSSGGLMLS